MSSIDQISKKVADMAVSEKHISFTGIEEAIHIQQHPVPTKPILLRTPEVGDLQTQLGFNQESGPLKPVDCIITSCDMEQWTREHKPLTEFGLPTLDTRDLEHIPQNATFDAIAEHIKHHHFRLRESGFYRNDAVYFEKKGKKPPGHYNQADNFQFGKSEWITYDQIEAAVRGILRRPDDRNPGQFRQVLMITHAGDGDMHTIGRAATPRFDMTSLISDTTELQTMTKEAIPSLKAVYNPNDQPGLHRIMMHLGFVDPVWERGNIVHNAGNDASFQLISALKLAFDEFHDCGDTPDKGAAQGMLDALMLKAMASQGPPVVGTFTHCMRCNHVGHNKGTCHVNGVYCEKCCASGAHATAICHEWDDAFGRLKRLRKRNYNENQKAKEAAKAARGGRGGLAQRGRGRGRGGNAIQRGPATLPPRTLDLGAYIVAPRGNGRGRGQGRGGRGRGRGRELDS